MDVKRFVKGSAYSNSYNPKQISIKDFIKNIKEKKVFYKELFFDYFIRNDEAVIIL